MCTLLLEVMDVITCANASTSFCQTLCSHYDFNTRPPSLSSVIAPIAYLYAVNCWARHSLMITNHSPLRLLCNTEIRYGIAVDPAGNVLVSDAHVLRRIEAITGRVSLFAGTYKSGYRDGPALASCSRAAEFSGIAGVAIDAAGRVFVTDLNNHRVRVCARDIISSHHHFSCVCCWLSDIVTTLVASFSVHTFNTIAFHNSLFSQCTEKSTSIQNTTLFDLLCVI
jgi:DNA-binding beta-propeller fold protein YncE